MAKCHSRKAVALPMLSSSSEVFLLTDQEDTQVNLKTLHKLLGGSSRFSFGSAEKMEEMLGVTPGAVSAPPVALRSDAR